MKFKKGDIVRVLKDSFEDFHPGDICRVDSYSIVPFVVRFSDGSRHAICEEDLELVEESKPESKFQVGDRVRGEYCGCQYIGTIGEITDEKVIVKIEDGFETWFCKVFPSGRVGAAYDLFDGHYLEKIEDGKPEYLKVKAGDFSGGFEYKPEVRWEVTVTPNYTKYLRKPKKKGGGNLMGRLSILLKKTLDADTKALHKAGVLNDELEVADKEFVLAFIVNKHKAELAKEARAKLREEKKNKDEEEE